MLKVSVIIPTLNRADLLGTTIDRIENQTVGRDQYEVIVIDNASTDHTAAVLETKSHIYKNLKVLSQQKKGAAATRNKGIHNASGDIILFIDDDIFAEDSLIETHLKQHKLHKRASIIGSVSAPWNDVCDPFLRYLRDRGIFNPYSITGGPMDFSYYHTGNVSTSRATILESGGFNEEFSMYGMEDIELGYRLECLRCAMVYAPSAHAVHQYFPTYDQFMQRCEQAGYSLGKLIELHPELRHRFVENGKRTRLLKRFHLLYQMFSLAARPVSGGLVRVEARRGVGPVTPLLGRHYYWAVRYHFFLGYTQYGHRHADHRGPSKPVPELGRQSTSNLAVEPRSKA